MHPRTSTKLVYYNHPGQFPTSSLHVFPINGKKMKYHDIKQFSRKLRNLQTPYEKILWERLKNRQLKGFKFLR
ncbi:MAG: DUF559 domain-containing protein [Bacteroidota bacterium]